MQVRDKLLPPPRSEGMPAAGARELIDSVGVIEVGERLDARAAERMKTRFKQFAKEGRSRHIIDLSRLDDLDSGGLATLISTLRSVRESGGSVHLVANTDRVTYILELTALTRLFKVHPTVKAALAAI
jgi:anti-sigma B factor antagonist